MSEFDRIERKKKLKPLEVDIFLWSNFKSPRFNDSTTVSLEVYRRKLVGYKKFDYDDIIFKTVILYKTKKLLLTKICEKIVRKLKLNLTYAAEVIIRLRHSFYENKKQFTAIFWEPLKKNKKKK